MMELKKRPFLVNILAVLTEECKKITRQSFIKKWEAAPPKEDIPFDLPRASPVKKSDAHHFVLKRWGRLVSSWRTHNFPKSRRNPRSIGQGVSQVRD